MSSELLPVHGFVLAGGKSSRMGRDKATMLFQGRPLIEIAVEKLRTFCEDVSIAGNRDDLSSFALVVHEARINCGPGAGIEAGLKTSQQPWVLFIPVDVPLAPVSLLRLWVEEAIRTGRHISNLGINGKQPAFCLLRREHQPTFSRLLDEGERHLEVLLNSTAEGDGFASQMYDEYDLYSRDGQPSRQDLERWFANINTPEDLALAEQLSRL